MLYHSSALEFIIERYISIVYYYYYYIIIEDFHCRNLNKEINPKIKKINRKMDIHVLSLNDYRTKYTIYHTK